MAFVEEFWEWPLWRSSGSGLCGGVLGVAFVEEFWDILKQIHNNNGLHAGLKKAFAQVCRTAYKVSWSFGHIHVGPEKLAGLLVTYM